MQKLLYFITTILILASCAKRQETTQQIITDANQTLKPVVVTDTVRFDTDDPAIWINKEDPALSLIVGTDKKENGGLYVFDLKGKIIPSKTVAGLKRPNNVDIEYGLQINGKPVDIAVVTERMTHKLRIYSLPDMQVLDSGGIPVFEGETQPEARDLMGISLYKNPSTGKIYAMVGSKTGKDGSYLWQYELSAGATGMVKATLIRKFGKFSGKKEIESIAVDDELGYVYYSDEGVGIHKYYADPSKGNQELALFAKEGFTEDHEGISIYKIEDGTGYILVSDQGANKFHIFTREGTQANPHSHQLVKIINTSTLESDGSEVTSIALNNEFKYGLFVAMSTDKTFQLYRWEDIAGKDLKVTQNGKLIDKKMLSLDK